MLMLSLSAPLQAQVQAILVALSLRYSDNTMVHPAVDTLAAAKSLEKAGFDSTQAEAIVSVVGQQGEGSVTKGDLAEFKADLKSEMANLKVTLLTALIAVAGIIIVADKWL